MHTQPCLHICCLYSFEVLVYLRSLFDLQIGPKMPLAIKMRLLLAYFAVQEKCKQTAEIIEIKMQKFINAKDTQNVSKSL